MQVEKLKNILPKTHWVLVDNLSSVVKALTGLGKIRYSLKKHANSVEFYNSYIDFALSIYIDKFKQLYSALSQSLIDENYLVYAMCGRSIIENAATLRYYARHREFIALASSMQDVRYSEELLLKFY